MESWLEELLDDMDEETTQMRSQAYLHISKLGLIYH